MRTLFYDEFEEDDYQSNIILQDLINCEDVIEDCVKYMDYIYVKEQLPHIGKQMHNVEYIDEFLYDTNEGYVILFILFMNKIIYCHDLFNVRICNNIVDTIHTYYYIFYPIYTSVPHIIDYLYVNNYPNDSINRLLNNALHYSQSPKKRKSQLMFLHILENFFSNKTTLRLLTYDDDLTIFNKSHKDSSRYIVNTGIFDLIEDQLVCDKRFCFEVFTILFRNKEWNDCIFNIFDMTCNYNVHYINNMNVNNWKNIDVIRIFYCYTYDIMQKVIPDKLINTHELLQNQTNLPLELIENIMSFAEYRGKLYDTDDEFEDELEDGLEDKY